MWGRWALLPAFLAAWATVGVWTVFALAVSNNSVNLTRVFPYISHCGSFPPQSCIFSQILNLGAAMAATICLLRYHQLQDWGAPPSWNQVSLGAGLLSALGTSIVGNFQQTLQLPTHLVGAFLAFAIGLSYFWLQLFLARRVKSQPLPGAPWISPLRVALCGFCSGLMVAMVVLHFWPLRSAAAACEWAVAMILFLLYGLFAVDFAQLGSCSLRLRAASLHLTPSPADLQLSIQTLQL
ncbi:modulator of macroautophagy TMEM150B isoform X1 [Tachyglossus aculeatus]|uniref:modulator of macroautophagy TMEM150B isoform X1 n=1 Tax=Tachyglossus aculeatus TaxID=9261 RepID=UPI0018F75CB5|nr:modulator of macroautophagy TMEM150B isoform X1 [Tachyglossus aculeatus]